jgi:hypothetical protein
MLIDGVLFEVRCPSTPRAVGANRAVIAASRSGSVGTQVVASAGRSRGNVSPKGVVHRTVVAVPETRSSSRRYLSAAVAACFCSLALGWFAQRASCGAVAARAVDAPNQLLQPTLDAAARPLPQPRDRIKRG